MVVGKDAGRAHGYEWAAVVPGSEKQQNKEAATSLQSYLAWSWSSFSTTAADLVLSSGFDSSLQSAVNDLNEDE